MSNIWEMDLTDEQWTRLETLIPSPKDRPDPRGRSRRNPKEVLNGILWILRTGAPWKDLPDRYPPYQTCHRWFQTWSKGGIFEEILLTLAEDLRDRGGIDIREAFIDGSFAPAKKGGLESGRLSGVRARRSWQLQTALVFLSPCTWTVLRRMK
jgi:transposase